MTSTQVFRPKILFKNIILKSSKKKVLDDVSGYALQGELLALMGPSGCGKTSLLNVISFRSELLGIERSCISGNVYLDGVILSKNDKRRIGYVMQHDIFYENLTLKETMNFYGQILLPKTMSNEHKNARIFELLDLFNLRKSLDTLIGGELLRGLSGGERKRTNICVEMLTDPDILILDEPTSGLDSGMAMNLLNNLKNLAKNKSKTIIASIHQPSSQLFFMFDKLMLMANGKVTYFGSVFDVAQFFEHLGFPCPNNWNISDHIICVVGDNINTLETVIKEYNKKTDANFVNFNEIKIPKPDKIPSKSSYWIQFHALTKRSFNRSSSQTYTFLNISRYFILAILIGVVFYKTPFEVTHINDALGAIFYSSIQNFMDPFLNNIMQFHPELTVIRKEQMSRMYRLSPYFIGKIISDLLISLLRPTIMWSIIYWMVGLNPSVWFLASLFVMYLMATVGQALGLLVASFGMTYIESMAASSIFMTLSLLVGGYFNKSLPVWLKWMRYLSPYHYTYVLQVWIQLLAYDGVKCPTSTTTTVAPLLPNLIKICPPGAERTTIQSMYEYISLTIPPGYYFLIVFIALILLYTGSYFNLRWTLTKPINKKSLKEKLEMRLKKNKKDSIVEFII